MLDRIDTRVVFNYTFRSSPGGIGRSTGAGGAVTGRAANFATASVNNDPVFQAVNYVISDIAFIASKKQQTAIQRALQGRFAGIAMTELQKMGRKITRYGVGLGPNARYPATTLSLDQPVAQAMRGFTSGPHSPVPMPTRPVTDMWRDRTRAYLERKRRKYRHTKWWLNSGDLRDKLRNPSMWTNSYGPIHVRWHPEKVEQNPFIARISGLARGRGRPVNARPSRGEYISTGTIHMSIMGRITRDMLNDPGQPAFNSKMAGLFDPMPEDVEAKLLGRWSPRVLVEPFLTYYINRQIPNRIFTEIDKSIRSQ